MSLRRSLCLATAFAFLLAVGSGAASSGRLSASWTRGNRRLLQDADGGAVASAIVPLLVDQSQCASFNADDAAPILGPGNSTLGWATIKRGTLDFTGVTSVQVDLTAHVSSMFLADSSASQADASNVRVCLMTDVPDACPVTSQLMYHKGDTVDCSKRRATIDVTVPPHIFNCSYATPAEYSATFYLQLEVDLAPEECLPPDGSFFAGSRRGAISDGCSFITITATCIPSTCDPPPLSADEGSANTAAGLSKDLLPVIVGVSVGTVAVVLAILGSVFYIRKRRREDAMRRKMQRRFSGAVVADSAGSTDTEDADELDFSGRSATGGPAAALGRRASVFMGGSALFSRTPRSMGHGTMARHASGFMSEHSPSFIMAQTPYEQHPGERLRQQGAVRFADKYNDQQQGGEGGSVRAGATPISSRGGAAFHASSGDSMAFTGHGSAEIVSGDVDLREDSTTQPLRYQLARMSAKMADFRSPRSPPLPPPAAAVTPSPGRTMAQMAVDLGFDRPWESPTTAESHASLAGGPTASLYAAEMIPDSASAFINPLAMLDEEEGVQSSEGDSSAEEYPQMSGGGGAAAGRHVTYSSGVGRVPYSSGVNYMPYGSSGGPASYSGAGGRALYSSGGGAGGGSMRAQTQMKSMSAAATASRPDVSRGGGASYGGAGYHEWQQQLRMQVDEGVESDSSEELQASERRRRPGGARRASQLSVLEEDRQLAEGPAGAHGDQSGRREEREAALSVDEVSFRLRTSAPSRAQDEGRPSTRAAGQLPSTLLIPTFSLPPSLATPSLARASSSVPPDS